MDREKVIKEWEAVISRDPLDAPWDLIDDTLTLLKEQEHQDRMFHALEDDWKRLKDLLKEQEERIKVLESLRRIEQEGR